MTDYKLIKDIDRGFVSLFLGDYQLMMMSFEEWSYLISHPKIIPEKEKEPAQEPTV